MKKKGIKYQIRGIEILSKQINAITAEFLNTEVSFTLKIEFKVQAETKFVIPVIDVDTFDKESKFIFAKHKIAFFFEIEDFEKNILLNKEHIYNIPDELQAPLQALAVSTTRGLLFMEFKGTYLGNAILPVVDISSLSKIAQPKK